MVRHFESAVNVSPLIRVSRWCMLLVGIGYGALRHSALQRLEDERRRSREAAMEMRNLVRPEPEEWAEVGDKVVGSSRDDDENGPTAGPPDGLQPAGPSDLDVSEDPTGPPDFLRSGPSDIDVSEGPKGPPEIPPAVPKGLPELPASGPLKIPPISPNNEQPTVSGIPLSFLSTLAGEYHQSPLLSLYMGTRGSDTTLFGLAARLPPTPSDGQ